MNRSISNSYLQEFQNYVVMDPYPFVLDLKNSFGMWLATVDGDKLFDWIGFYGAKFLGSNHPRMYETPYVERLVVAANNKIANPDFLTPECVEYYRKLFEYAPRCMLGPNLEIYAVNSGAEAVENLSKYFLNLYDTHRAKPGKPVKARRMVYFDQAYHGRTIFALNMTQLSNSPAITKNFEGLVVGNLKAPFPAVDHTLSENENRVHTEQCLDELRKMLEDYGDEIVGIIVEPIQGAGGHRVAYPWFFQRLSELAHDFGVYLGFDEVQTAGGQCGQFFLCDNFDLPYPPQGIASGKKLSSGVVYMQKSMNDVGILDSTWGGNLVDMVRFVQEMRIVEDEKLIEQVAAKTVRLVDGLEALARRCGNKIFNIRGAGLYQGFSMRSKQLRDDLVAAALKDESLLLLEAGRDSIRLRPPLNVTHVEIDLLLEKLERCLNLLSDRTESRF
jgi:L-lysine 6-transaminase